MRKPLDPGEDLTLLAAREEHFQLVFHMMACVFNMVWPDYVSIRRLLDDNINVITRFIEWLLQSGQNPNIPVKCSFGHFTSALQSALQWRLDVVVGILIQHNANADVLGRFQDAHTLGIYSCQAHLPPLVLAMMSVGNPHSDMLLSNIEKHRTHLEKFLSLKLPRNRGIIPEACEPDIDHPLYHLLEGSENEVEILSVLETIRTTLGSSWLETPNHSEGLLFHASRAGYVDVLGFLLDNNVDINITNTAGSTALHNAVIGKRSPYMTCLYLLEHGAVLERNAADMSAFHLACSTVSDVEVLRLLCFHNAHIHRTISGISTVEDWLRDDGPMSPTELRISLENNSTPLKAAINNMSLDPEESIKFCMQMGQSSTEVVEWIFDAALHSPNNKLLPAVLRTCNWHTLRLNKRDGLLRNTMDCCNFNAKGHTQECFEEGNKGTCITIANELLEAGVKIGSSDAIRALILGDWHLAQKIRMRDPLGIAGSPLPLGNGSMSFLEAALLCCPRYAFEAMMTNPYDPGALCAAAFGVCENELSLDIVEGLLINRSTCNSSTLDPSVEMAAIGIAIYNDRTQLLELLRKSLPTHSSAHLPGCHVGEMEAMIGKAYPWWHGRRGHGSVACFALNADIESFTATVKQYGWDMACLSLVIENRDVAKAEVLMNHKTVRQNPPPTWSIDSEATFPPLVLAIKAGDAKLVQVCVMLGESIHGGWDSESHQWKAHTALAEAVSRENLEIIDLILQLGADVNQKGYDLELHIYRHDSTLYTPLQRACIEGHLPITKRLIDRRADLNAVNDEGLTALEYAAMYGRLDMVQLFLSAGVDLEGKNREHLDSAISMAGRNGHEVTVKLLKAHAERLGYVLEDGEDGEDGEGED